MEDPSSDGPSSDISIIGRRHSSTHPIMNGADGTSSKVLQGRASSTLPRAHKQHVTSRYNTIGHTCNDDDDASSSSGSFRSRYRRLTNDFAALIPRRNVRVDQWWRRADRTSSAASSVSSTSSMHDDDHEDIRIANNRRVSRLVSEFEANHIEEVRTVFVPGEGVDEDVGVVVARPASVASSLIDSLPESSVDPDPPSTSSSSPIMTEKDTFVPSSTPPHFTFGHFEDRYFQQRGTVRTTVSEYL